MHKWTLLAIKSAHLNNLSLLYSKRSSISVFRWIIIFFPNKSERIFTRRKSKMMIAVCWVIPLLFLLPSMTGVYGIHGLECLSRSCTILKDEKGHSTKNFLFAFGFGLPTLVLLLTNISIYIKIKVSSSNFLFWNRILDTRNYKTDFFSKRIFWKTQNLSSNISSRICERRWKKRCEKVE